MSPIAERSSDAFWDPKFHIEHRDDGNIVMAQEGLLPDPPRSMPDLLVQWAGIQPDTTYLAERDDAGEWCRLSYAQVLEAVRSVGNALLEMGLGPQRPVLILSENSIDHALLGLAAQYVGIPYAPVSSAYSLMSSDHGKLKDIASLLKPGLVFASDGALYGPALAAIAGEGCHVAVSRNPRDDRDLLFETLTQRAETTAADAAFATLTPQTVGKYLFTSGSTGSPKAVINTQYMMTSNQVIIADCFRFLRAHPPIVVEWAPWNHTAGGNKVFNMVLFNGGTFYIDEGKPSPQGIAATIRNLKEIAPTWCFNVPVGYEMLVSAFEQDDALRENFFSRLDMMMYAGAGMAQHTWDDLLRLSRETAGHEVLLTTGLGATETGPFALMCTQQQAFSGNVGVPAKGVSLKLVPNGGKLEARLKSPSITPGYYGDAGGAKSYIDDEGYYMLGDALRPVDPDDLTRGFFFDGRTAENFKLSTGTWVAVGALRARLINHFGGLIRDAVIVGESRSYLGAIVLPNIDALQKLGTGHDIPSLIGEAAVRAVFEERLSSFAAEATGSASRVRRLVVMETPPDLDKGEMTDKGSINQRAVIANRPQLVEAIYSGSERVIEARKL